MKGFGVGIVAPFVAVLMFSGDALCMDRATQEVREEVRTMKDQVNTMQNRIDKLEQELEEKDQEISQIKEEETKAKGSLLDKVRDRLSLSGDVRLRYEYTDNQDELDGRHREVLRGRFNAAYRVTDALTAGMRLATGSADDPNTEDVTAGSFVNDFDVNLTRLYLNLKHRDLFLTGGKFENPFVATELVWDGDVNPLGAAGSYTFSQLKPVTPRLTLIYSVVDEQSAGPDSDMLGGQASVKIATPAPWSVTLAGAYYDYHISSLTNADSGDIGSNNLNATRTDYLSDFDLFDAVALVEYRGFGERYPVQLVGDYVKNHGAAVDEDQGYSLDLFVGRVARRGDYRFRYGYSVAETDAVLAAFSHDNTTFPTNYRQHTLSADYVIRDNTFLNLTWYLYRRDELGTTPETDSDDYASRLRVNVVLAF